jgi:hypothetical protein
VNFFFLDGGRGAGPEVFFSSYMYFDRQTEGHVTVPYVPVLEYPLRFGFDLYA